MLTVCVVLGLFLAVFVFATRGRSARFDLSTVASGPALPSGTRIVFFGDSITAAGSLPGGYIYLIDEVVQAETAEVDVIASGVEGDDVRNLLDRVGPDVLNRSPGVVVIFIGVNDAASVSDGAEAVGTTSFRSGLVELIERVAQSGARAVVCTPAVLDEHPYDGSRDNRLLDEFATVVREIAAERGLPVCDLRRSFTEYLSIHNPQDLSEGILTLDGVHFNSAGNRLAARVILETLGRVFEG